MYVSMRIYAFVIPTEQSFLAALICTSYAHVYVCMYVVCVTHLQTSAHSHVHNSDGDDARMNHMT